MLPPDGDNDARGGREEKLAGWRTEEIERSRARQKVSIFSLGGASGGH